MRGRENHTFGTGDSRGSLRYRCRGEPYPNVPALTVALPPGDTGNALQQNPRPVGMTSWQTCNDWSLTNPTPIALQFGKLGEASSCRSSQSTQSCLIAFLIPWSERIVAGLWGMAQTVSNDDILLFWVLHGASRPDVAYQMAGCCAPKSPSSRILWPRNWPGSTRTMGADTKTYHPLPPGIGFFVAY